MAYQNTNAVAYTKLRPIQNNDIGRLIEERIRYWKKYDDDEAAKQKALALQKAKYQLELQKFRKEDIPKLDMPETVPYLQDQLLNDFNNYIKPQYIKYADAYEKTGDKAYLIEMERLKNTVKNYALLKPYFSERVKELKEAEQKGTLNPYLDKDKINFFKGTAKGQYYIDKGKAYVLDGDKLKEYNLFDPNSPLFTQITGSGNPNFKKIGADIQSLVKIDKNDGNIILTKNDKKRVFNTTKDYLLSNDVAWKTWKAMNKYDPNKKLNELDKNKLIKDFQDKFVYIQQITNPTDIALKRSKAYKNWQSGKKDEPARNNISIATYGKNGKPLKIKFLVNGQEQETDYIVNIPPIDNKGKVFMVKNPQNKFNVAIDGVGVATNSQGVKKVVLLGKQIENQAIYDKFNNGDLSSEQVGKVLSTLKPAVIQDKVQANAYLKTLGFDNITDFINTADEIYKKTIGEQKPPVKFN